MNSVTALSLMSLLVAPGSDVLAVKNAARVSTPAQASVTIISPEQIEGQIRSAIVDKNAAPSDLILRLEVDWASTYGSDSHKRIDRVELGSDADNCILSPGTLPERSCVVTGFQNSDQVFPQRLIVVPMAIDLP